MEHFHNLILIYLYFKFNICKGISASENEAIYYKRSRNEITGESSNKDYSSEISENEHEQYVEIHKCVEIKYFLFTNSA